jgi:hypothetical protein
VATGWVPLHAYTLGGALRGRGETRGKRPRIRHLQPKALLNLHKIAHSESTVDNGDKAIRRAILPKKLLSSAGVGMSTNTLDVAYEDGSVVAWRQRSISTEWVSLAINSRLETPPRSARSSASLRVRRNASASVSSR